MFQTFFLFLENRTETPIFLPSPGLIKTNPLPEEYEKDYDNHLKASEPTGSINQGFDEDSSDWTTDEEESVAPSPQYPINSNEPESSISSYKPEEGIQKKYPFSYVFKSLKVLYIFFRNFDNYGGDRNAKVGEGLKAFIQPEDEYEER